MNTERDVLFLALSSHGDVYTLIVSHGALMLQDLAAADLAAALKESGIKWRVIVISACHAGSFIDELRNPNTIVITASAADKTSFGCSDERFLTYFGEAFYRDALPGAKSLRDAFETAKAADIGAREKREDIEEASDPQAFFGEAIERHSSPPATPAVPLGLLIRGAARVARLRLRGSTRRSLSRFAPRRLRRGRRRSLR